MLSRRSHYPGQGSSVVNHAAFALVSKPAVEPVTQDEIKRWAHITSSAQDPMLDILIAGCRQRLESWLRRSLITQTWEMVLDWGPAWLELPKPPIQSIVGVWITGLDGTEVEVDPATYFFKQTARMIGLYPNKIWPTHGQFPSFRMQYISGYGDGPSSVPESIKLSLYNMCAWSFDNRLVIDEVPQHDQIVLESYRIVGEPWRMAKGVEPLEFLE